MGDSGEERERVGRKGREWGIVGKKGEKVGDSGEERGDSEGGCTNTHLLSKCEDLPLVLSSKLCVHFQILFIKSLYSEYTSTY